MPVFHLEANMKEDSNFSQDLETPTIAVILGAGHFGQRALSVLAKRPGMRIYMVDDHKDTLAKVGGTNIKPIHGDAVEFLLSNAAALSHGAHIIPAVPFHLAYEFAFRVLGTGHRVERIPVPAQLKTSLPHVWQGDHGSLLVSYADFRCPDDCPEPKFCTVTGQRRDRPLYELLGCIDMEGYKVSIIRSHQMGPGVGGYSMTQLLDMCSLIRSGGPGRWLLGTACKCHGVLSGLEIRDN